MKVMRIPGTVLPLQVKDLTRHSEGTPGDHLVVNIGENTQLIVDTSSEHRDIRISDGDSVYKIRLKENGEVLDVMENDVPMSPDR